MRRDQTISTKLTVPEIDRIHEQAEKHGLKPSVFFRRKLLGDITDSDVRLLLIAELRAMRAIQFELVAAYLSRTPLTDQLIRSIVAAADAEKYIRAEESLLQFASAKGHA